MPRGSLSPTLRRFPVSCSLLVPLSPSLLVLYSTAQHIWFKLATTSPMVGRWRHSGSMHLFASSATRSKSSSGNLSSRRGSASSRTRDLSVSNGRACRGETKMSVQVAQRRQISFAIFAVETGERKKENGRCASMTYPCCDVFEVFSCVIDWFASREKLKQHHSVAVDIALHQQVARHSVLGCHIAAEPDINDVSAGH